jgi:hypothetical protein
MWRRYGMQALFDFREGVTKRVARPDNHHTTAADEAEAAEEAAVAAKALLAHNLAALEQERQSAPLAPLQAGLDEPPLWHCSTSVTYNLEALMQRQQCSHLATHFAGLLFVWPEPSSCTIQYPHR